jgi:hypothetical protein
VERIEMAGQSGLVGGDDMGAAMKSGAHDLGRIVGAADQLDDEHRDRLDSCSGDRR